MSEIEKDSKPAKVSGRYRKVEVRIWGDEKFRELSPIPPCGQGLFLFLITGPHTGPVPGLFRAGRAAMAEELGWELEAFDQAFQEAFRQGLVIADFKARVMWVPNAIKHNKPESPNVVKSWAAEFDLIPECDLKRHAFQALKASIHALGEPYGKAFDETFGKAIGKPLSKPIQKTLLNQEQEQEQEQIKGAGALRVVSPKEKPRELDLEFVLPDWIPAEPWAGFVEMRKKQRKVMTDRARDLKISELRKFLDAGHDVGAILDKSTANCWIDLYEPKGPPAGGDKVNFV